jgi:hypothetical protein
MITGFPAIKIIPAIRVGGPERDAAVANFTVAQGQH